VTRDNLLFLVIGALLGFIAGYLLEERMAEVQPPLRVHGASEATSQPASTAPGTAQGAPAGAGAPVARIAELQRRVTQDPQDSAAARELGNANFDIGNWQRAAELYQRYLEIEGDDPNVLIDLGLSHRAMGDLDAALSTLDRALEADPEHWLARFNKAIVLGIDVGDLDAAGEVVEEMRAMRPNDPDLQRLEAELERRRQAG
jgi:tetratricopeptide (TPR) repeat protein